MSEKQTTFFTINCAEKLESPNQCMASNTAGIYLKIFSWACEANRMIPYNES
jgi:hypothetical protein